MLDEQFEYILKHSENNRKEIYQSNNIACFHCCNIIKPYEIKKWVNSNKTALCPNCGMDSLIGDSSQYPVENYTFLAQLHDYYFNPRYEI